LGGNFVRGGAKVDLAFGKGDGLIPAVIQDDQDGSVLMLGFMDAEAYELTRKTGEVVFFSRSRNKLWRKGESSGHLLKVSEMRVDCDADALLVKVKPLGPGVCHEGYRSCFYRRVDDAGEARIIEERVFSPEAVYGRESSR
jgi:phosphoribosyl-AMP cyclohydrolase